MKKRLLPVGIQSFKDIREKNFVYVDKTEYVWKLSTDIKSYFLSRPRRFGKSLFISTLESYFSGEKELFKGLYIEKKEPERGEEAWAKYPVISFYLSGGQYNEPDGLNNRLISTLTDVENKYDLEHADGDVSVRFEEVIKRLYKKTGRQVVVLVDEYDKPLLSTMISNPEQEEKNRELYKGFFSILKDMDDYLRFVFFTGVTKFTKVSIFSDLNQLYDISMDDEFSGICGITENEMVENFEPEIELLADKQKISRAECLAELEKMYDGYHFSKKGVGVYNPFTLLSAFLHNDFGQYWFETGSPDLLIKKLQNSSISLPQLTDGIEATEYQLMDYGVENRNLVSLFYQTGYLTICGYDREVELYSLKMPNDEVKYGFLNSLVPSVLGSRAKWDPKLLINLIIYLEAGELELFFNSLEELFASIPYPEDKAPKYEKEWSRQLFLILSLMGAYTSCEVHMATGRADCVVKTPDYIYVFEFKLDKPVEDALSQIDDKGYAVPYTADNRKLYKIGVVFSTEKRNVSDYKVH